MCKVPNRSRIAEKICCTLSLDDTSQRSPRLGRPSISFVVSASVSVLISQMATLAPSFAIASAIDLPKPCPPPVTRATLSFNFTLASIAASTRLRLGSFRPQLSPDRTQRQIRQW
jgi:hypothetical protein